MTAVEIAKRIKKSIELVNEDDDEPCVLRTDELRTLVEAVLTREVKLAQSFSDQCDDDKAIRDAVRDAYRRRDVYPRSVHAKS